MRHLANTVIVGCGLLVSGCASNIPQEIQDPPIADPTVNQVRDNIDEYTGSTVRWGGIIASVENRENETWIEVVAQDLGSYGQPQEEDSSYGRFLVRIEKFIDPQIYAKGRELTVAGVVESRIVRPIGEHPYTYPLIRATSHYLWPEYAERDRRSNYFLRYHYGHPFYHGYGFGWRYHPYYY